MKLAVLLLSVLLTFPIDAPVDAGMVKEFVLNAVVALELVNNILELKANQSAERDKSDSDDDVSTG
ncbi:MAG: hypothetical protein AAFQ57_14300 [Cyanobacteria bacterium J06626_14]